MANELEYPLYGMFTSRKGINWHYAIYSDLTVEMWHRNIKRVTGGWTESRDTFAKPTKECKQVILAKYGLTIR